MLCVRYRSLFRGRSIQKLVLACVILIVVIEVTRQQGFMNVPRYGWLIPRGGENYAEERVQAKQPPPTHSEKHRKKAGHVSWRPSFQGRPPNTQAPIHVATVVCGKKVKEGRVMLKSVALFSGSSRVVFHVFTEDSNRRRFLEEVGTWPRKVQERFELRLYNPSLPTDPDISGWTNPYFKPCSNHRLFLHSLLPDVDAAIYLDSDVLVLFPIEQLWATFAKFTSVQIAALAPESEDPKAGWYVDRSKIPYVSPAGLNSGVMLMNLTRLRHTRWTRTIVRYSRLYRPRLELGDQDLINIYFYFHPGEFLLLDCALNYRTDHCQRRRTMPASSCGSAENQGAYVLHGNREAFHLDATFSAVYAAFSQEERNMPAEECDRLATLRKGRRVTRSFQSEARALRELHALHDVIGSYLGNSDT